MSASLTDPKSYYTNLAARRYYPIHRLANASTTITIVFESAQSAGDRDPIKSLGRVFSFFFVLARNGEHDVADNIWYLERS